MSKSHLTGHPKPLSADEPRIADLFAAWVAAPNGQRPAHVPNRGDVRRDGDELQDAA